MQSPGTLHGLVCYLACPCLHMRAGHVPACMTTNVTCVWSGTWNTCKDCCVIMAARCQCRQLQLSQAWWKLLWLRLRKFMRQVAQLLLNLQRCVCWWPCAMPALGLYAPLRREVKAQCRFCWFLQSFSLCSLALVPRMCKVSSSYQDR